MWVIVFQLMKGNTPIRIFDLKENIQSEEVGTSYFNIYNPEDETYSVEVFVFDQLYEDRTVPYNLTNILRLKFIHIKKSIYLIRVGALLMLK